MAEGPSVYFNPSIYGVVPPAAGAAWNQTTLSCNATTGQIYGTSIGPQDPSCPIMSSKGGYVAVPQGSCYCNGWYESKGQCTAVAIHHSMTGEAPHHTYCLPVMHADILFWGRMEPDTSKEHASHQHCLFVQALPSRTTLPS